MAVKLRLARLGAKKKPYYRIVAATADARRDGSFLDHVGVYDPTTTPVTIRLKPERVRHWLGIGAKPTDTVNNIIKKYLSTAEQKAQAQGLDTSKAIWVQGPDNSPAAQGVKGGPAEHKTRPARRGVPAPRQTVRSGEPASPEATNVPAEHAAEQASE